MYRVELQVVGHAREFFPGGQERHEIVLPAPVSVRAMLAHLGVPSELVMAVFVEDRLLDKDEIPPPGARVVLMTPPSGG